MKRPCPRGCTAHARECPQRTGGGWHFTRRKGVKPDGAPAQILQAACDHLLEASIPAARKTASSALAADWTDIESWSRPPRHGSTECHDPEARWGHRNSNLPGPRGEMFFGYYLSAVTMAGQENGPAGPELARRMTICSCALDPARALIPVLEKMPARGIPLGDIIAGSGYSHRVPPTGPPRSAMPAHA